MTLPTRDHWIALRDAIKAVPVVDTFADLEAARESLGVTLGLVRPSRLLGLGLGLGLGLDITLVESPDWTDDEKAKLKTLKKLPFDFHYRYACETAVGMS